MHNLPVSGAIWLDQVVSVNGRFAIGRILADDDAVLTLDKIKLPVASFDPVVANELSGRAIFQIIAQRAGALRTKAIVSEGNAKRGGVAVVLKGASRIAVVVD